MPEPNNDIDALLDLLAAQSRFGFHSALAALVAERDGLREGNLSLVAEGAALRKRVETLELQSGRWRDQHPPADRDRELRERLVCAALTGFNSNPKFTENAHEFPMWAVCQADSVLAAMRKGGGA
jgi:hypothetical protein